MKKITTLLTLLTVFLLMLALAGCSKTVSVELAPYMDVQYSGYNGNGTAQFLFDYSQFEYEILSQWGSKDQSFEKLMELTALENTIFCSPASAEGLCNGDTVTVTMTFDEKLAKELGYKLSDLKTTFTVKGLTEPIQLDPFAEDVFGKSKAVDAYLEGTSPYIYLNLINTSAYDQPTAYITYQADKNCDLKNGDTVTITATLSDRYAREGYILTRTELTLPVEGFNSYISDPSMLCSSDVEALQNKMRDFFAQEQNKSCHDFYFADGDSKTFSFEDFQHIGQIEFTDNGYAALENGWSTTGTLIIPFRVDMEGISSYWWNDQFTDEPITKSFPGMYGYFAVTDLLLDGSGDLIREGSFSVNLSPLYEQEQDMLSSLMYSYGDILTEGTFAG